MSYDIRFGVKVVGAPDDVFAVIGRPDFDNPTYNIKEIFVKSMDWDYQQGEWYSMVEVLPKVQRGIHELIVHGKDYKKYEDDKGWGTVSTALDTLQSIQAWFADDFYSHWDTDIPLECIYMRW